MEFFRRIFAEKITGFENKLPLEKFIPSAFLIFLISMITLSLITFQSIERYKNDIELINHSNEIIKEIEEIKLKEFELPLYKKGYLITRNENFNATFDTLIKNTNIDIKELKELTFDNPSQQELIKLLESITLKNIEAINSSAKEFPEDLYSQKNIDATNEIQNNLYQIDDITKKLELNELSILNLRNAEAEKTNSLTQLFIIITGAFSFIVIGLSLFISDKLISAKVRTEKQLSDSYNELDGRVEERTMALSESNKKLSVEIIEREKLEENLKLSQIVLEDKVNDRTSELLAALTNLINESKEKEEIQNRIKIFAHAIKSIKDSIFICDLENKIIFVNQAFQEKYGYDENDIIGNDLPILNNINNNSDFKKDILIKSFQKGWKGELYTKKNDGSSFITYLSTSAIKNEEGTTNAWAGICQDITELKNAEEELKSINIKLVKSQKEVIHNEKFAALGRFSAGVAHEIRNPLANINSLAQLISKATIDEKNKRRIKFIITNVDIANKIIKSLLNFASPDEPEYDFNNLNLILNTILESVEARCKEKKIKIIKEIPEQLTPIHIDKLKIENALMNFISNSIDAMPEGGELTVKVLEDKRSNEMIIDILDTGEGIPEENIDKILEPFFTTKDEGIGLGMGLAYRTIKLQGGKFKIESKEGFGTKIEIKLPIKEE